MSVMDRSAVWPFASDRMRLKLVDVGADRQATFLKELGEALTAEGITLLDAELGRERECPLWLLTLQLPNQHVLAVRARVDVDSDEDPLGSVTCQDIARRVIRRAL